MILNLQKVVSKHAHPAVESLIEGSLSHPYRWLTAACLGGLYLLGLVGFGFFFEWGNFDMLYHDWAQISGPRLQFLQSALKTGQLPLQISDAEALHLNTQRYLSAADVFTSPQYILLYKLPLSIFELVNTWFLYTVGFVGLLFLRRKLRLSPISFAALFLLFNFNGHILAHTSMGHASWGGYFLFPWFAWLVFRLLGGDHSWLWTALVALLLFCMWLQGSFHQYVWLLLLLGCIGIFVPRTFWVVMRTGVVTILISAFRILPCILNYNSFGFINGYPSLYSVWENLVKLPDWEPGLYELKSDYLAGILGAPVGAWELTCYVGLVGGLFLVFYGIYRGLFHREAPYRELLLPLGIIFLLSLGATIELLRALPVPLIQGERVSARLFSVVLVFGLILGAERFQRWLDTSPLKTLSLSGSLVGLGLIAFDLWQNFAIWRVSNRKEEFWVYFDPHKWTVRNDFSDTLYITMILGGLAITLLTILVLGVLCWREQRAAQPMIKKIFVVVVLALGGWEVLMVIGRAGPHWADLSTLLILRAITAPIIFSCISWYYFNRFAYTTPLKTALIFTGTTILMDVLVFFFFMENGYGLLVRSIPTWICYALIGAATYLVGKNINKLKKSSRV
jgi:hypothetical protein